MMVASTQWMSRFPGLSLVKKKYLPSGVTDGMYSWKGELTFSPMFTGSVQEPSACGNATYRSALPRHSWKQ